MRMTRCTWIGVRGVFVAVLCSSAAASRSQSNPIVPPGFLLEEVATGMASVQDLYLDPFGRLLAVDPGVAGSAVDGTVEWIRPDGTRSAVSSGYVNPRAVLVDEAGVIYVCDYGPTTVTGDGDGVLWKDEGAGPVELVAGFTSPDDLVWIRREVGPS